MARGPPTVANPVPSVFLEPLSSIIKAELYPTMEVPRHTKPYQRFWSIRYVSHHSNFSISVLGTE